jgi:hypothetical protein
MEAEITQFPHGRMTAEQFDAERARLRGLYGDSRKEAGARYEQALARPFYVSGWTLDELAKKERKVKSTVSQMLIFGRFLGFLETWNPPESGLSAAADKSENVPLSGMARRLHARPPHDHQRKWSSINDQ